MNAHISGGIVEFTNYEDFPKTTHGSQRSIQGRRYGGLPKEAYTHIFGNFWIFSNLKISAAGTDDFPKQKRMLKNMGILGQRWHTSMTR